jgi:Uma2 family endonuclease
LESRPEPDLLWIRAGRYLDRHPSAADVKLVIEVADSSLQSDLIEKAALYAEANIVEYWTVDVQGRCVHIFRSPSAGTYADRSVAKCGEHLSPLEPCQKPLDLGDLFNA